MFWNRRPVENKTISLRRKWRDYSIPPEAYNKYSSMAGGFIQAVSVVINFIGVVDNRKAEKYEVTFAQIIDLLLRDCFLIGMEIGKTPMPNEAKEILAFVGEPLVEFIYRLFSDGFRLGLAPKDDIARITRTTLEQTYMVCKQTYDIGVLYNPNPQQSS